MFKSSKSSLWPVYLALTSISPNKRMRLDNVIIAALYHGPTKPDMDVLLCPIRECGSTLYVGMPWKKNGRQYNAMESDHCKTHQQARSNLPKPPRSCL